VSNFVLEAEHRVTPLELFFDLVFVFAFTQVTALLHDDVSWGGLARGLLVLAALWWAWASYAWLTNTIDANAGLVTAAVVVAVAAMFVAALAVPDAFGRQRLLFGVAFLIVILTFVGLFALAARGEPDLLSAVIRMARTGVPAAVLILGAAFVPAAVRPLVWLLALVVAFGVPLLGGVSGWRVHVEHFAERHGLILIIAIGEALVEVGFAARGTALGAGVIATAAMGVVVAASLWLAYFDYASIGVQQQLAERRGTERIALARDLYTYLHLPLVAGIILFAFGMSTTVHDVGTELHLIPALALCGGSALYLLMRLRVSGRLSRGRATAAACFVLLVPLALHVPALAAVALVTAVWVGLHTYELIWWREERARRRAPQEPAAAR
jgi:low temperature requirement protein LtrA